MYGGETPRVTMVTMAAKQKKHDNRGKLGARVDGDEEDTAQLHLHTAAPVRV